jgi:20S proteasome alpha/beta subunit
MTVCVAALCDKRKSLILVADKMVGIETIESELEIEKYFQLHRDWWVMFAGALPPAFDILERAKSRLRSKRPHDVQSVIDAMTESYHHKQNADAERLYLQPIGWTLQRFNASTHSRSLGFCQFP